MTTISDRLVSQYDIKKDLSGVLEYNGIHAGEVFSTYPDKFRLLADNFSSSILLRVEIPQDNYEFKLYKLGLDSKYFFANIDFGDGIVSSITSDVSNLTHIYEKSGNYRIKIENKLSTFLVNNNNATPNAGQSRYWDSPSLSSGACHYANWCTSCITDIRLPNTTLMPFKHFLNTGSFCFTGIKNVDFLNDIASIDNSAENTYQFLCCKDLTSFDFEKVPLVPNTAMFAYDDNLLCVNMANVSSIPDGFFFSCHNLSSVIMTNVKRIGTYSFKDNKKLISISANECSSIGSLAFIGNSSVSSVYLSAVESIGHRAFTSCNKISSYYFPNLLTIDGEGLGYQGPFESNSSLTTIYIPKICTIGNRCFSSCGNLLSIDLNDIEHIGSGAFSGCSKLSTISISDKNDNFHLLDEDNMLTKDGNILIDVNNKKILWTSCNRINADAIFDDTISSVGFNAFAGTKIKNISGDGITNLEQNAFNSCTELTSIHIGNVNTISQNCFSYCTSILSLDFNKQNQSSQYVQKNAFDNCRKLSSVVFGNIKQIGQLAFNTCYNLKIVDLSYADGVPTVQSNSFANIKGKVKVIIKKDMTQQYLEETSNWKELSVDNKIELVEKTI